MEKPVVFHLKRSYFEQIKLGIKECEYRFKFPSALQKGSLLRDDDSQVMSAPIVSNGG